jgi:formate hydrogenlyase subunit 3/multisubunit Na+/H+ antiporter MnhD subunit
MSTLSFFLVIYDYENEENRQGGFLYIFMTHLGTAFIMVAFILMYLQTGSFSFESWVHVELDDSMKFWVFLCVLIGFGTKAGMFPLHVWLPKAHPVAPSNISALMSGIMIKTAIYMMVRFYFYFLEGIPWWYGFIILLLGALSALFGVMYALSQHDLKRLLAYHSIENIGIILMGLGSAMLFNSNHMPILASFGLLAALFHTYNHAIFKSLLFLGSGATFLKTHTKDMEKYGGLIKLMPYTALFFIIGSISISALPPFNGFVSEWLTYQSLLLNNKIDINIIHIFVPLFASMLALTGAFAAACFVKVIGISFLGSPRSDGAKKANEVGRYMVWGMGMLAVLCAVFGLFPNIVVGIVAPVTSLLLGIDVSLSASSHAFMVSTPDFSFGHLSTFGLSIGFMLAIFILFILIRKFGNTKTRICPTWGCGQLNNDETNQYTASGFSQPIRRIFGFFYHPKEKVYPISRKKKYFFPTLEYNAHSHDGIETIYNLILKIFVKSSSYLISKIENGSIHIYLLYIFITSVAFLVYAVKGGVK